MLQPTARATANLSAGLAGRVPTTLTGRVSGTRLCFAIRTRPQWLSTSLRRCSESDSTSTSSPSTSSASTPSTSTSSPSSTPSTAPSSTSSSSLPWYLKVDVPKHATLVPVDVPLPDVPPRSPTVVEPLLQYVADDLGLDGLVVLDLRSLDPPAALGQDLIMLLGTARSEKHLHVSADRLVRWLRSEHNIRANADGLLGRNELKIKLRRRARKAKLLGVAGGSSTEGKDDGVSTNWVCLTATTSKPPLDQEEAVLDEQGRVVGFGPKEEKDKDKGPGKNSATIVVQMMTDAKRQDLDLETLWLRTLRRNLRAQADEEGRDVAEELQSVEAKLAERRNPSASTLRQPASLPQQPHPPTQQRFFSTSTRRPAATAVEWPGVVEMLRRQSHLDNLHQDADGTPSLTEMVSRSSADRIQLLDVLSTYFRKQSLQGRSALLFGSSSSSSAGVNKVTAFVEAATKLMHGLSPADTWKFRSSMHAMALTLGRPEYTLEGLRQLVNEMRQGGLDLTPEHAGQLMQDILLAKPQSLAHQARLVLWMLETLQERGEETVETTGAIVHPLMAGVAEGMHMDRNSRTRRWTGRPFGDIDVLQDLDTFGDFDNVPSRENRRDTILDSLAVVQQHSPSVPCPDAVQLEGLLRAFAMRGDWPRVWTTWRQPAQHGQHRPVELYAALFTLMARHGGRRVCTEAVAWLHEEMLVENPQAMDCAPLRQSLLDCMNAIRPQVVERARDIPYRKLKTMLGWQYARILLAVLKHGTQ